MVPKQSAPTNSGFFGSKPVQTFVSGAKKSQLTAVNLGNDPFLAVAAAMVDHILSISSTNQELTKIVLEFHKKYFKQEITTLLINPLERRLEKLLDLPHRGLFLKELAYALRREVINEFKKYPETYRRAFAKERSLEDLKEPGTKVDQLALFYALKKLIPVPIEGFIVEPNKPVRQQLPNNQTQSGSILLQFQEEQIFPLLHRAAYFEPINWQKMESINPIDIPVQDFSLDEIHFKIAKSNQQLLNDYIKAVKWISEMVQDEKMIKEDLIDIYLRSIPSLDQQEKVKYPGTEFGNQQFFEELEAQNGLTAVSFPQVHGDDLEFLIKGIARAITLGKMDPALVYGMEEQPHSKTTTKKQGMN